MEFVLRADEPPSETLLAFLRLLNLQGAALFAVNCSLLHSCNGRHMRGSPKHLLLKAAMPPAAA